MQTAVLAMGIGEGGRAGIAIDDADAGESGDRCDCDLLRLLRARRISERNLIMIPFSCEAAGSEK